MPATSVKEAGWINRSAERAYGIAESLALRVWELSGRRPAVVFFGAVGSAAVGLLLTCTMAHLLWEWLFPPSARETWTPASRWLVEYLPVVAKGILLVTFVALSAMFWIWWERKVSARIQSRLGPMHTGGWHGWSQSLADGIKLLGKEDLIPRTADRVLFRLAPYVTLAGTAVAFLALPFGFGPAAIGLDLDVGVLFILAALSTEVTGILLAGWASGSKWAVLGGLRAAAQMVVYEIPLGLALLVPVLYVGSLSASAAIDQQAGPLWNWLLFRDPFCALAFVLFFVTGLAAGKRAPFDLPEAESELVAGFHTEYSGIRWVLFFMAEYGTMYLVSGLAAVMWLGGPHTGLLPFGDHVPWPFVLPGPAVVILKATALVFVQMWIRWTLPRLRVDQVLDLCVKTLLPLAIACLLGTAVWKTLVDPPGAVVRYESVRGSTAVVVDVLCRAVLAAGFVAVLGFLVAAAVASRREARHDERALGPAWDTWGARVGSDRWAPGYAWRDPEHRKPEPSGNRQ